VGLEPGLEIGLRLDRSGQSRERVVYRGREHRVDITSLEQ
jgi:hypothetical protein